MENLPKKIRSKKLSTRVDLTAMVSVSFLLIIFFMVTIELAKPKGIGLGLPDRERGCGEPIPGCYNGNRFYTVLLGENDKLITYAGLLDNPLEKPRETNYSKKGFHSDLKIVNKRILEHSAAVGEPNRGVIVFIKPSSKSNYGNLVDILNEMKLANIEAYAIVDEFTPEETKLLTSN